MHEDMTGLLVVSGFIIALSDSVSVYSGPSSREREKEKNRYDGRQKPKQRELCSYCKHSRYLPYYHPNKYDASALKVVQHNRPTRSPTLLLCCCFASMVNI